MWVRSLNPRIECNHLDLTCSHIALVVKKRKEGDRYIERKQSNVRKKSKVKENTKERKIKKVKENRKDRKERRRKRKEKRNTK